jgi:hypothetical protein
VVVLRDKLTASCDYRQTAKYEPINVASHVQEFLRVVEFTTTKLFALKIRSNIFCTEHTIRDENLTKNSED